MPFRDIPLASRLYIIFLILAAGVTVFYAIEYPSLRPWDISLLIYLLLTLITARMNVKIPYANVHFSIDTAFIFLILITFGLLPAIIADISGKLVLSISRFKYNLFKVPFNIASGIISVYVSYLAFNALFFGRPEINPVYYLVPILGMTTAYYLTNTLTVAVAISIAEKQNLVLFWIKNFLPAGIGFFIASSIATLMFILHKEGGTLGFLVIIPMVLLIYFFQKLYLSKEEASKKYIHELENINKQLQIENSERKRAEAALSYRVELEKRVNTISTNFINLPFDEINDGIDGALEAVGKAMGFDRGYVYQVNVDTNELTNLHLWYDERLKKNKFFSTPPSGEVFTPMLEKLKRFERVYLLNFNTSKSEEHFQNFIHPTEGIQSIVVLPMIYGDSFFGFLGFDSVQPGKSWPEEDIALLKTVAEMIVNAVGRHRIEIERTKLEEQLLQSQKMEAIGRLAGGVAHDFNNLLTGIMGNINLAELDAQDDTQYYLSNAVSAVKRATRVVNQLLTFSRRSRPELSAVNPADIIAEATDMLRQTIDRRIFLTTMFGEENLLIYADPAQFYQIIMNLCINARDAISGLLEGRADLPREWNESEYNISIELSKTKINENYCRRNREATPGDYVLLRVSDNGTGIGEKNLSRIFEPFYTTKDPGKGTGLGLPTVFGIVKSHGGWIGVESKLGKGTTFMVYFPQYLGVVEEDEVHDSPIEIPQGHETILLIDDEVLIRELGQTIFEKYGYKVLLAEDGKKGIDLYKKEKNNIDLVILDQTMPHLSGLEVLQEIRSVSWDTKVLMTSGYPEQEDFKKHERLKSSGFIAKPFDMFELLSRVREVLEA